MKNITLIIVLLLSAAFIVSCGSHGAKENKELQAGPITQVDSSKYSTSMVDNKKDPSCGMPLSAGIEDTVHYQNKVLGFCSKECKDDFLKNPKKNIAAAELKK